MLHIVNKSPFERNSLESCMRMARNGSGVLLIEDGVYGALQKTALAKEIQTRMKDVKFYALGPDLSARGLGDSALIDGVKVVDYGGFVDLVAEYDVNQSWL